MQNYYAPQIFANLGMSGNEASLFATGIYGVVKTAACAVFLVLAADSLGRRNSLLWTSIGQAVVMYIIGIYGRVEPPVDGRPVSIHRRGLWHLCWLLLTGYSDYGLWICRDCLHLSLGSVGFLRVLPFWRMVTNRRHIDSTSSDGAPCAGSLSARFLRPGSVP